MFICEIGENINEYIASYMDICNATDVSNEKCLKFFHHIFDR